MTHVSRPFQIFMVAFVLFVAVWFVALRDHTSSTTGAGSSVPAPPSVKTAPTKSVQITTHATVVHKTTNGNIAGATVVHKTTTTHATVVKHSATTHRSAIAAATPTGVHGAVVVTKPSAAKPAPSAATKHAAGLPKMQAAVERQLQQNKTVLILFWNPNGYDDTVVHGELPAVQRYGRGSVVVHYASAKQVGEYGTITNAVQVNQTPTLLIVEPHGQTTTITGLTEAFAIDQAIAEARHAAAAK